MLNTRRAVLKAGLAVTTLGSLGLNARIVVAQDGSLRAVGHHRYDIGDVRCTALYDGYWEKPHDEGFVANATVEEVKAALEAGGLTDAHVTIEFAQTLLETGGRTILIDAGTGGQMAPTAGMMPEKLAEAGFAPEDIDTVLVSHFHPDHIFGLMAPETNAQTFPDAEIVVPAAEYAFWTDSGVFARLPEGWHPLARRIQATFPTWANVRQAEADVEVAPGVRSLAAPGHTPGHTAFHVASGDAELIVAGDTALTPALFVRNPGWHVAFDADPELAERTRRRLFDRIAADGTTIAGYHFGFPNAGRLHADGDGYSFEPLPS